MKIPAYGDVQYKEHRITKVQANSGGWVITVDSGWCFGVPSHSPVKPTVGAVARFYGRGDGHQVRGLTINGVTVFYRSEAEQKAENQREAKEREKAERQEFEDSRAEFDAKYAALPEVFQRRLDRFRAGNPDFRWKFEGYEMFCCTQALAFAAQFPTEKELDAWSLMPYEKQKAACPAMEDGHSGNTFGCAVLLAKAYLSRPELVPLIHGALTPLVGCEAYGCTHPAALDDSPATPEQQGPTKEDS